jgi:hypothetical protein
MGTQLERSFDDFDGMNMHKIKTEFNMYNKYLNTLYIVNK